MFKRLNHKVLPLYVRGQAALGKARDRFCRACAHVRRGTASEAGQGFLEYVIMIGGVLIIGIAIFALFHTVRSKYESANSALESLPIEGGW